MKFKEQFPSLREVEHSSDIMGENLYSKYMIQKHCLDKQKVIDAIVYYEKHGVGRYEDFKEWLRAELGLNTQMKPKAN